MAWIFSLWVEAEKDAEKKSIQDYFDGRIITVNGKEYTLSAYTGGMVTVNGISRIGVTSQQDADEMTSIGNCFYELLKDAPEYRYALVGVEVDGFAFIDELIEDPEFYLKIKGLVINERLYHSINGKRKMKPFTDGYLWNPYEGEVWKS